MSAESQAIPGTTRHVAGPREMPLALIRRHGLALLVLTAFACGALVVPVFTPVAISDDWTYARSAQILLAEGRLTVFPIVVATAIFPIVWGALFGLLLGSELGVFRLSTVAITALGALALYALCRELGVSRPRSALGMATFLFNPLVFVLAYSFMTDPHFVALLIIATWVFVRALTPSPSPVGPGEGSVTLKHAAITGSLSTSTHPLPARERAGVRAFVGEGIRSSYLLAGSAVSSLAFLTRHQGALIVVAMVAYLLLSHRVRFDRAGLMSLGCIVAIPALVIAGYMIWLRSAASTAAMQASFIGEVGRRGWDGTWWLVRWLPFFELMYLGFFTLPLFAATLPGARSLTRRIRPSGWLLLAFWTIVVCAGVAVLWARGVFMPYVPQFFGASGLGPPDVLGSRPILLGVGARMVLTVVCLLATVLLALIAARGMAAPPSLERSRAALVVSIGLWQMFGVLPPSYHFVGWSAGSVDRYLEPLAPIAIALALWGLRDRPLAISAGWVVAGLLALFAIAGTRDELSFMGDVWSLAEETVATGVPMDRLDAGASWDGYHLYELGAVHQIQPRTPLESGPWWTELFAPATDSTYVVATKRLTGYEVIWERPSSSWLNQGPTALYLLRRQSDP